MKADPDAQQHMQEMYRVEGSSAGNFVVDYENMEESLRNMLHHNGRPSTGGKEDTARQIDVYKNALSKFRNHINYVERENHVLKGQIASIATQTVNGDSISQSQRTMFFNSPEETSQLEDIRSTCVMLSERIKRMEEQNNILLMSAEKQRCDYERCLDRVASQVFQTLTYQRRLQMECDSLRMQLHHLTGSVPGSHSPFGSNRSSESSQNGQSTRGSASDEVFGQYGNFVHGPWNAVRNEYHQSELPPSPYSVTVTAGGGNSPGTTNYGYNANQVIPGGQFFDGKYYGKGLPQQGLPQQPPVLRDAVQFNNVHSWDPQYERQAMSPHRIQTAKTPPLHAIPESIEPTHVSAQNLVDFRPRLPRSGSETLVGPLSRVNASGPQRTALDDEAVGRTSRSRDRQRSMERNKVTRSRSFDGYSSHARAQPSRPPQPVSPQRIALPSYRPGPPLKSAPRRHRDPQQMQELMNDSQLRQTALETNTPPMKHDGPVSPDLTRVQGDQRPSATSVAKTSPETNIRNNPLTSASCTAEVPSSVMRESLSTGTQDPKSPVGRALNSAPLSRGGLQRSFRVTRSCERREQRRACDDVWLPRSGGPGEPMAMRIPIDRLVKDNKQQNDPSLPPPPPPPPKNEMHGDDFETETDFQPNLHQTAVRADDMLCDTEKRDERRNSYAAACQKSQSLDHLRDVSANVDEQENSPEISPVQSDYATFDAFCNVSEVNELRNTSTTKNLVVKDKFASPAQKSPTQSIPLQKSTKREAPKPPIANSVDVGPLENALQSQGITPAASCDALSSPDQSMKAIPRRQSEGVVRELSKKTRLATPPGKSRGKGKTKLATSPPLEMKRHESSKIQADKPRNISTNNMIPKSNDPSIAHFQDKIHSRQDGNLPDTGMNAGGCLDESHLQNAVSRGRPKPNLESKKPDRSVSSDGSPKELLAKEEIKFEKKSEINKKKSGNQKSFVGMMKSKFGGKGLTSKKIAEVEDRQPKTVQSEVKPTSVIDPRTLSLEPNSFAPENIGKKASKKDDQDPVGRKLSRPFLNTPGGESVAPNQPLVGKTELPPGKRGFLGRHSSKRSKNTRHAPFQNGDHFNSVPYGRVELIPIGAPVSSAIGSGYSDKNLSTPDIFNHEHDTADFEASHEESTPRSTEGVQLGRKTTDGDFAAKRREMNDYENIVLLNNFEKGNLVTKEVASHSYENVVIVNASVKSSDTDVHGTARNEGAETTTIGACTPKDKCPTSKQISPLQKIWSSLSNHSLNKISGSESGSRTTLHEIGGGRCIPGQFSSDKKGNIYASEQQMFEKAFISSVVEAQLGSRDKKEDEVESKENDSSYIQAADEKHEMIQSHPSIPDYSSHIESGKSSMTFSTTDSSKSANSGFDSWPSKSTGPSLPTEAARGGSLDARFRDIKSVEEMHTGGQSYLQKRTIVDSHSSLGSFGYGSGVSGSSTTSSNKSRGRSPQRQNFGEPVRATRDSSSSDNDIKSTPEPSSLPSRYAARRFASPIGGCGSTTGGRLQKSVGLPRPKGSTNTARAKMYPSGISPPKVQGARGPTDCIVGENEVQPRKLAPLTCSGNVLPTAKKPTGVSQIPGKGKEPRKSGLPMRAGSNGPNTSRFGVPRTSIPARHSGSRAQQHIG